MTAPEARDAVVEEFYLPHYRTLLPSTEVERLVIDSMAEEIVRQRQIAERAEANLAAVKTERDTLRNIVKNYGKARLRHLLDRKLVQATFAVNYQVLKDAREPEMLFATAISDVMHKLREFMHAQEQANAAQQQITAMADAACERAKSRFPSTAAKQEGDA
jgi:hypothetical protein